LDDEGDILGHAHSREANVVLIHKRLSENFVAYAPAYLRPSALLQGTKVLLLQGNVPNVFGGVIESHAGLHKIQPIGGDILIKLFTHILNKHVVAVTEHNEFAHGSLQPEIAHGANTPVVGLGEHPNAGIQSGYGIQQLQRVICGTIVHTKDFNIL
jgi:hypothetical protein